MKTHKRRIISAALGVCMGAASVAGWSSCGAAHTNEFIEAVQASCLQEGNVAHWRCRDCGETFFDEAGEQPLADAKIPALGHNSSEKILKDATCTESGVLRKVCLRCGAQEDVPIPATGHKFGAFRTTVTPTCTSAGEETRTCPLCGASETRELPASGAHHWDRDNRCTVCSMKVEETEGLLFSLVIKDGETAGYLLTDLLEPRSEVVVPYYHNGLPVLGIGEEAFRGHEEIRAFALYAPLEEIRDGAFEDCFMLGGIRLPEGLVSIGANAFRGCGLSEIVLPDSLRSVGENAFYSCDAARRLSVGSGLTDIGTSAFYGCFSLTEIEAAEDNPFFMAEGNCLIARQDKTVLVGGNKSEVPEGVLRIGDYAFLGRDRLLSVSLPKSLVSIGDFAFRDCTSLTVIVYNGSHTQWLSVAKGQEWNKNVKEGLIVRCNDGDFPVE